ncbi:MAG: uroporphyrinogen-III synthase, partial [Bacteroidota bacterium]|nr:uroporphyrinogen-III synthase [Bacteroidota bacterium]
MLNGKIIINTRPEASDDQIAEALCKLNATVVPMPLIEIKPIAIDKVLLYRIMQDGAFQWLIFTSKNGVDGFFDQLPKPEKLPFRIAVYGLRTAEALQEQGYSADLVNQGNTGAELLDDLLPLLRKEDKVLIVTGNLAPDVLQDRLNEIVTAERLDVYHTQFVAKVPPQTVQRIASGDYDLILFTSPSGVKSFVHHVQNKVDFAHLKAASIGPSTTKALL